MTTSQSHITMSLNWFRMKGSMLKFQVYIMQITVMHISHTTDHSTQSRSLNKLRFFSLSLILLIWVANACKYLQDWVYLCQMSSALSLSPLVMTFISFVYEFSSYSSSVHLKLLSGEIIYSFMYLLVLALLIFARFGGWCWWFWCHFVF